MYNGYLLIILFVCTLFFAFSIINKSLKKSLKIGLKPSPLLFALLYALVTVSFALIYEHAEYSTLNFPCAESSRDCLVVGDWTYLYFSVITITTLGYGDISPLSEGAQILAAMESFLGIVLIGLFLNELSNRHSIKSEQIKREALTVDFNNTVDEIKSSSQEMVAEIKRSSQEMINQVLGGDSYPIMDIRQNSADGKAFSFIIKCVGTYPIYDLKYTVENIKGFVSFAERYHASIMPGFGGAEFVQVNDLPGDEEMHLRVHYKARNGSFFQDIKLTKVVDTNQWARKVFTRATWYGEKSEMNDFKDIDKNYPEA